jgi:hypothetical protein
VIAAAGIVHALLQGEVENREETRLAEILSRCVLDAVLLFAILVIALGRQIPPWRRLAAVCLGVAASNAVWMWWFYPWISIIAIVPLLVCAGLILRLTLPLSTHRIVCVLAAFVATHVVVKALKAFFP